MKNVYLFIKNFSPKGGVESFCYRFREFLLSKGYRPYVVCASNTSSIEKDIIETGYLRAGRFTKTWSYLSRSQKILSQIPPNATSMSFGSIPGCTIFRTGGVHKNFLKKSIKGYPGIKGIRKRASRSINPINYYNPVIDNLIYNNKNTKFFISISKMAADEIKSCYNISEEKIRTIPNGVDTLQFNTDARNRNRTHARSIFDLSEKDNVIGFSSTNFELKGLGSLIETLSTLPDSYKLLIAGNRNPEKYKKLAKKLHVEKRISFLGYVKDMPQFYSALDLLCHPSAYDTFGSVVAEALAMGLPVITTKNVGAASLITEMVNGHTIEMQDIEKKLKHAIPAMIQKQHNTGNNILSQNDCFKSYLQLIEN